MSAKYFLYLFVTVLVVFAMDSINLNGVFKKIKYFKLEFYIF